jgi:hypothetical protein
MTTRFIPIAVEPAVAAEIADERRCCTVSIGSAGLTVTMR